MIFTHSNNNVNVNKNIINDVFFFINQNMNKKKIFSGSLLPGINIVSELKCDLGKKNK